MRIIFYSFLIILLSPTLTSCSNERRITEMWGQSVVNFDSGHYNEAMEIAKSIKPYDKNSSDYLVSQYMIYSAAVHGENFGSGLETAYQELLGLNFDIAKSYKGHYIAARAFAQLFLHGTDAAVALFKLDCKNVAKSAPPQCMEYLLWDALRTFEVSHGRLESVYLYEISRIGSSLNLISKPFSRFYMALSLMQIDNSRANAVLRDLNAQGLLTAKMKNLYCEAFVPATGVKKTAFTCE